MMGKPEAQKSVAGTALSHIIERNSMDRRNFLKAGGMSVIGLALPIPTTLSTTADYPINLIQEHIDANPAYYAEVFVKGWPGMQLVSFDEPVVKIDYIEPDDIYLK